MTPIRARFNERRELVLPPEALEALGARPGDEVDVSVLPAPEADRPIDRPESEPAGHKAEIERLLAMLPPPRPGPSFTDEELEAEIRRAREEAADERWLRSLRDGR